MENRILIETGWEQRIRDKLGVDPAYLPDEVIRQPDCINVAEANIISTIPDYSTLDGDSKLYLEYAVVLECCILLSTGMDARLPKKETGPHAGHELWIDWTKKKIEFQEERDNYIGKILELEFPNALPSSLPHFTVTYPIRKW